MKTTKRWAGPLMGAAVLALPMPASAQDHAGGRGPGPTPAMIAQMQAQMQAREADDTALLLNLRADQRPALTAFLASMTPPPPPWRGPMPGAPMPGAPGQDGPGQDGPGQDGPKTMSPTDGFAQQLDRMTQDAARRSAEDAKRIAAARTFYDSLDPTQRRAFEALMRVRHGRGPGFGPMGPGPMGPGPMGPGPMGAGPIGMGPMGMGGDGPRPPMGGMPPRP